MKRIITVSLAFMLLLGYQCDAQSILGRLGQRAKNAAENAVGRKIEKQIEQSIDEFGKNGNKEEKETKQSREEVEVYSEEQPVQSAAVTVENTGWTCPKCGQEGNTGKFCSNCGAPKEAKKVNAGTMKWNNYDFVAGDEIIFDDDNTDEPIGEFPMKWDAFSGAAEIVEVNGEKCINLQEAAITPLFIDGKTYLSDCFTFEFDVYVRHPVAWEEETGQEIIQWPELNVSLVTTDNISPHYWNTDEALSFKFNIRQTDKDPYVTAEDIEFFYSWTAPNSDDIRDGSYTLEQVESEAWHHIAISFNKRAYKIYFDNQRVANIPNARAPKWLDIKCHSDLARICFIKNVRIAKGAVPLYDRLASEGKIVTYGITFDTGKAIIKPESTGEINRIKAIMEKDPGIRFEVQGHCDSTGSAEVNNRLSQQRAEAIVNALVEGGISAERLTAVGKGSSVPVGDNSTEEGRAKNRRVEFIKL